MGHFEGNQSLTGSVRTPNYNYKDKLKRKYRATLKQDTREKVKMFHGQQRWHVVYTAPNAEAIASKAISDLGFPVFTPFEKRVRRLPNRKPQIYGAAYFPRYGFVRFDIDENKWPSILKAKGVLDILRNNAKPLSITDRIIDALKVADRIGLFDKTRPPSVGMSVEVTSGPFSGLLGRIMRARTGDRMDVMLRMFGAEVSATIPVMALREISK